MTYEMVEDTGGGLVKVRENDNEFYIPRAKFVVSQTTAAEKNRRRSKYCTDYKANEVALSLPFDPTRNPEILAEFNRRVFPTAYLIVGASPDAMEQAIQELSAAGVQLATDYVRAYGEGSNGVKYDLMIEDPKMPNVDFALGMFLGPWRLVATGRYQISRSDYIQTAMSQVRILEIGETPEKK